MAKTNMLMREKRRLKVAKKYAARRAELRELIRNPKTGAKVDVPAKRVPFFKPSKELRDSVNPNGAVKSVAKKADADHVDPHHPPAM